MTPHDLAQQLIYGLSLGATYALIALGYTMVYGTLRLINFAHGDVYMVGAVVGFYLATWMAAHGGPLWLTLTVVLIGAMLACGVLGYAIERFAYRPLRNRPRLVLLITAIGVSLLLENSFQLRWIFGPTPLYYPQELRSALLSPPSVLPHSDSIAPVRLFFEIAQRFCHGCTWLGLTQLDLISLVVAVSLVAVLTWIVLATRTGLALRAVSFRFDTSMLMGINTDKIIAFTFIFGSALAAVAGVLNAIRYQVEPLMGIMWGLKAFIAAVLGGIGSVQGALVGGLVLGLVETLLRGVLLPPRYTGYSDAAAFVILILILLLKPSGLLGRAVQEKV
jgi:branched-chain amino acid transport system permease protein